MAAQPMKQNFQIDLPATNVPGLYADFASVWHTPDVFVIDFIAIAQPPAPVTNPETGAVEMRIPGQIIQRVRIPPAQVFEMAKALTQQLEAYEQEAGKKPPFDNPTTGGTK